MHISEGILPIPLIIIGWILSFVFLYISQKRLQKFPEKLPFVALFASLFFVASLIHVPLGPTSVHLTLNGLIGVFLGDLAFLAIFVGLFFQAIFFNFGGLLVLGVNAFNMGFPAVLFYYLTRKLIFSKSKLLNFLGGFLAGFGSVLLAAFFVVIELGITNKNFIPVAKLALEAYIPIALLEGIITAIVVISFKPFLKYLEEEKSGENN